MSATSISVARILQLKVPIAWQEAVELARIALQTADAAGQPLFIDECVISIEGTVHIVPSKTSRKGSPVTVLSFLRLLLEGQDAPAELRALVDVEDDGVGVFPAERGNASAPRFDLSWFASPRPELEIARLAARAVEIEASQKAQTVIERIRSGVPDATQPPTPSIVPTSFDPRVVLGPLGAAAAVIVLLATGFVVLRAISSAASPARIADIEVIPSKSFLYTAFDSAKRVIVPARVAMRAIVDVRPAVDATPARNPVTAAKPRADRVASRTPASRPEPSAISEPSAPSRPSSPPDADVAVASAVRQESVVRQESTTRQAPTVRQATTSPYSAVPTTTDKVVVKYATPRVYSQLDAGIEPPAFMKPQMPTEQKEDTPPSESYLEVTVDERGQVVQVRLRSADASLNDRMIVAAAKTWQFRPALKDGQPVPYVLQIPVTR